MGAERWRRIAPHRPASPSDSRAGKGEVVPVEGIESARCFHSRERARRERGKG
jgi:hypothetical protein